MLNTFLLSMRGTPYTYYGDELGMTNIDMPDIKDYVDVSAIGDYKRAKQEGQDMNVFMKKLNFISRENARTPMQWDKSENAGFTKGQPWKRVNENYEKINVAAQEKDPKSVLNHFRKMTKLRNQHEVLVYGDYQILQQEHPEIYAYTRTTENQQFLVLLNFKDHQAIIELSKDTTFLDVLIDNYDDFENVKSKITLKPYQAIICEINN